MAQVPQRRGAGLGERAVAIVEVEEVVFLKIVGDVQVGAAVEIQVARNRAETVSHRATVQAGALAHIDEVAPVVAVEAVAPPPTRRCGPGPGRGSTPRGGRPTDGGPG